MLYGQGDLAQELGMAAPEDGEGLRPRLEAQKEEHDGVEDDPGAVGHVAWKTLVLDVLEDRVVGRAYSIQYGFSHFN